MINHFFKLAILSGIIMLSTCLTSCEKEEVKDTCQDNAFTPGEEGIDCGGPCEPCVEEITVLAYATIDGVETRFDTYSLEKYEDWVIKFFNDTVSVTLNLGDGDSLGLRPIKPLFSEATLFSKDYSVLQSGRSVFTNINDEEQRLSFYFDAQYTLNPESQFFNPLDTLFITQGDFVNIPWENQ